MPTARYWPAALFLLLVLVPCQTQAQQASTETIKAAARRLLGRTFSPAEIDAVASVLELQIATFPIGTSSGGFTFKLDPTTGALQLKSPSFGPLFAERASTLGEQGNLTLGLSAQATRFVSYEGRHLRNGELRSRTVLDGEIVDINRFTFDVETQTTHISVNYAADDTIDVGIIIPIVRTSLSGTASSIIPFQPQREERTVDTSGSGLGDVVLRGKWNFRAWPHGGLAAMADLILPTGSEDRFSSTGHLRIRSQIVASAEAGAFSPHVNIGYTFGGNGVQVRDDGLFLPVIESAEAGDEINYAVGADVAVSGSLTVFADLVGRSFRSVVRFDEGQRLVNIPLIGVLPVESFVARAGTLNTRLAAIGAKTIVLGKGLIYASLLFPLNEGGLEPGLTPVIGFEYTF